jgi:hypothetical protein
MQRPNADAARRVSNEIGHGPVRARPSVKKGPVERWLSGQLGKRVRLGPKIVVSGRPTTCPACGSKNLMWGCDTEQKRTKEEVHPLVWDEDAWDGRHVHLPGLSRRVDRARSTGADHMGAALLDHRGLRQLRIGSGETAESRIYTHSGGFSGSPQRP